MKIEDNWIPITEQEPPIGEPLIVTVKDGYGLPRKHEIRFPVYYLKSSRDGIWYYMYQDNQGLYIIDQDYSKAIAWMRFPEAWEGDVDDKS